jgi:hypothetical protein
MARVSQLTDEAVEHSADPIMLVTASPGLSHTFP